MIEIHCENSVTFRHNESRVIKPLQDAWRRCQMAEEFVPAPKELTDGEQLQRWRLTHWGVSEDFGQGQKESLQIHPDDGVQLCFTTYGDRPDQFYDTLTRLGFEIDVRFLEVHIPAYGCESDRILYCGRINGAGRHCFKVQCLAPDCLRRFINDEDLLRSFDFLSHALEEWDEEDAWWTCECDPRDTSWGWPIWPDSTFTEEDLHRALQQVVESDSPHDKRIAVEIMFLALPHEQLLAMFEPKGCTTPAIPNDGDCTHG